jgi:glutathione S-transferase
MAAATLTINSRNYGSWSLRGWLLCTLSGIDFDVDVVADDDEASRAELLLLSPSFLVPRLTHDGVVVWDVLAIAEYLNELLPDAGLLPHEKVARALCRSVSGEIHSGFVNLRSGLPMDLRAHHPDFKIWSGVQSDIDRIVDIWHDCLDRSGGPFLFGATPTMADAMYAPVCTRLRTYGVELDSRSSRYCDVILGLPAVVEWTELAQLEPREPDELDMEF